MTHTIRRLSPSILLSFPCLSIFVAAYLELNIIGIGINECHCKGIAALGFDVLSVGGWSTAGCSLRGVVDDTIVCECNHMTNFAALVVSNLQRSNPAFSQFRYIFAIHTNYNVMLSNKYGRYRLRHIIRKKQETHVWKFTRTPQYVTKASEKPLFLLVWIPPHPSRGLIFLHSVGDGLNFVVLSVVLIVNQKNRHTLCPVFLIAIYSALLMHGSFKVNTLVLFSISGC